MVLPETVSLTDAIELAAMSIGKTLSDKDLGKQFYPSQDMADVEADLHDALELARARQAACEKIYPFDVTDRSITFAGLKGFNAYAFLLLGRALNFGGPVECEQMLGEFRDGFEDVVCWAMRKYGFTAEVLSIPRAPRGLPTQLAPALREIALRFREPATLRDDRLMPHDNDLDVDVLGVPIIGNGDRGGWPVFQIQCATGSISGLEAKIGEGASNFTSAWEKGFFLGSRVRGAATPDDLLTLDETYWHRLGQAGWIIDRTRIAYLASGDRDIPLPPSVAKFWDQIWAVRGEISWQTGWQ
ncbi:MAG: hypothetical protein NTV08_00160 [Verrucomicrobia bacterium]|nr:hypothetical protein [Verrucomicrobiota bacterium]